MRVRTVSTGRSEYRDGETVFNGDSQLIASTHICCASPDLRDWQQETDPRPQQAV